MDAIYKYENYFIPVGRILMGAFFLLAGVSKVTGIVGTSAYIASVGLPAPTLLAWAAGLFLILAGGSLIAGYKAKHAAFLLALYTLLVTFIFHSPASWAADPSGTQQTMFMKNAALLGGLLFMARHLKK